MAMPTITDDELSSDDKMVMTQHELPERWHPDLPQSVLQDINRANQFQDKVAQWVTEGRSLSEIPPSVIIPDDDETATDYPTPKAELLAWHYHLGHLSFARIRKLAERGDLPGHLGRVHPPKCAACMFGKATRRPWRMKAPLNANLIPPVKKPGDVVGIDQLISSTPGFIAQM